MTSFRNQRGFTMVSLMVGAVLSLLVVVAMLSLFKAVRKGIFEQGGLLPNARQDAQLASGLLSAQRALQGAGFGILQAQSGVDFLVFSAAAFDAKAGTMTGTVATPSSVGVAASAVAWQLNTAAAGDAASMACYALLSGDGLVLLRGVAPCQPIAANWSTQHWTPMSLVGAGVLPSAVAFKVTTQSQCWPFGSAPKTIATSDGPTASVQVSMTFTNSTHGTGGAPTEGSFVTCLPNLQ